MTQVKILMYYHLSSQSTVAREKFSRESWPKVLSLAMAYGWKPIGTHPAPRIEVWGLDPEDWDGTYLTNDGQIVVAEDALSLAIALEKALDDIPDFVIEEGPTEHPFEYFAGDEKGHLVDFIKFCQLGSFIILRI